MMGVSATEAATLAGQWGERAALAVHVATRQAVASLDVADAAAAGAYECAVMAAHCARERADLLSRGGDVYAVGAEQWGGR